MNTDIDLDDDFEVTPAVMVSVMKTVERRLWLGQNGPNCPVCDAVQVQLTFWTGATPAQWRCRECGHRWSHEPTSAA